MDDEFPNVTDPNEPDLPAPDLDIPDYLKDLPF